MIAIAACLAALSGCAVVGGAGTATIRDDRIDARGAGAAAGVDRSGPYAGVRSGRVIVE
jgi:hypothetical protein